MVKFHLLDSSAPDRAQHDRGGSACARPGDQLAQHELSAMSPSLGAAIARLQSDHRDASIRTCIGCIFASSTHRLEDDKEEMRSSVGHGMWRVLSRFYPAPARRYMTSEAAVVDLRSDTVTQPCAEMRSAMARAAVGDDVYGEDPTVAKLESQTAALLGKEDAVFLPSGTMANLACILSHTNRGDEVVLGRESHIQNWEQGNVASLASCIMKGINTHHDGTFSPEDLRAAISYDDPHVPRTRLVCLENSHGGHSGTAVPACFADAVGAVCAEHNLALHIDGARILNAAVALQVAPAELTRSADTVTMCLSKGLGAPVGSMAAGSAAHMHSVRRWRKALGGGMRQAGLATNSLTPA